MHMMMRHRVQADVRCAQPVGTSDRLRSGKDVGMAERDEFWFRGRAGGLKNERDVVNVSRSLPGPAKWARTRPRHLGRRRKVHGNELQAKRFGNFAKHRL